MKWWQKLVTWVIMGIAICVAFLIPTWLLFKELIIENYTVVRARWSFVIAFALITIGIVGVKVLSAWYKRRLQSMDVADELGIVGTTPIVVKRILLLLQVAFPLGAVSMFLYGLSFIEIPSYTIFLNFGKWFIGGFFIFLVHDYVKRLFYVRNAIEKAYKLDVAKEEYRRRTVTINQD
jgi:hypothetical protein